MAAIKVASITLTDDEVQSLCQHAYDREHLPQAATALDRMLQQAAGEGLTVPLLPLEHRLLQLLHDKHAEALPEGVAGPLLAVSEDALQQFHEGGVLAMSDMLALLQALLTVSQRKQFDAYFYEEVMPTIEAGKRAPYVLLMLQQCERLLRGGPMQPRTVADRIVHRIVTERLRACPRGKDFVLRRLRKVIKMLKEYLFDEDDE